MEDEDHRGQPAQISEERLRIPYKGYSDWREWVDVNRIKFAEGSLKRGDPNFYRFLISHKKDKLREQAEIYIIVKGYVTVHRRKITPEERDEFIEGINNARAKKGRPPLIINHRSTLDLADILESEAPEEGLRSFEARLGTDEED